MISIVMGSKSDLSVMQQAKDFLDKYDIENEIKIVSAHRTPEFMFDYAKNSKKNGIKIIIAGAGGAAHLPGMIASLTTLPVIGVPIKSSNSIEGIDSLLSIVQMPNGVPVATMAINAAKNAGIFAMKILGVNNEIISKKLESYSKEIKNLVLNNI
jgi:5-(carboxyamino)imidazole ribonucleotide mutase